MTMWDRHAMGPLRGAVAGIAAGIGGAAKTVGSVAGALGGLGGGSGGSAAGDSYAQQVQMAMLANAERQAIADDYFDGLIGKRTVRRGKNKGQVRYGNRNELLMGQKPKDVFGTKPKYHAVDFQTMLDQDPGLAGIAGDVTAGNLENFQQNARLAEAVNNFLTMDSRRRVDSFDPYLLGNIEATGRAAQMASQGLLPMSDMETLVGGANERASLFGTPGTSRGQVARDLGLTQLDLQTRVAPTLTQTNAALINAIAPPQMRDDPRSREVQTSQALQIGAADNQFEAEFDRREQNLRSMLAAIPDPRSQGLFNLQNTLRAQQFMIDFGLANGYGVPGTMPENLGSQGSQGFMAAANSVGSLMGSIGSIFGGGSYSQSGYGTPGIFG